MATRTKLGTGLKKSNLTKGDFSWRNCEIKPVDLDLVEVQDSDGIMQYGWWAHNRWNFGRKKIKSDVVFWRKIAKESELW